MTWFWLGLGLVILTVGAEFLVRGAVGLASAMRISPLVIGLTVVAFGTSAPELVVSVRSALAGRGDIALGNVVGSNIFNVLVILGLAALIVPLRVHGQLVRFDVPVLIVLSLAAFVLGLDGRISQVEGGALVMCLGGYTAWSIHKSRLEKSSAVLGEFEAEYAETRHSTPTRLAMDGALVVIGLAMLVYGGDLFIQTAVEVARAWGLSELVIGLTLVAAGTSLPEVATSLVAAIKGERDIAVGNVIGSNIFNLMGVLGLASVLAPGGIAVSAEAIAIDLPVMVLVAIACLPVFMLGYTVARWEACILLAFYVIYTLYVVGLAQGHDELLGLVSTSAWILGVFAVGTYAVLLTRMWWRHARGPYTAASGRSETHDLQPP